MNSSQLNPASPTGLQPQIAIACGGTGGHLFPGMAVAESLAGLGYDPLLLVSPKEVDQRALRAGGNFPFHALPAVGLGRRRVWQFLRGLRASVAAASRLFAARQPVAVLAMGGFTSAPPVWVARRRRIPTFLHEANSIPGRANRWLAHIVDRAFVYFPDAAGRLSHPRVEVTGMPVRAQFDGLDPEACRIALGLAPDRPVLLITGGSQGATPLNDAVLATLPELQSEPTLQFVHLTGIQDADRVRRAYAQAGRRAVVQPFLTEMELALGAATLAIARAGASSLAEIAACRLPAVLVPYPWAADNHQYHNAKAWADAGAARLLPQANATPNTLGTLVRELLHVSGPRRAMAEALGRWHQPDAAERIARAIHALVPPNHRPQPAPPTAPRPTARIDDGPPHSSNPTPPRMIVPA